MMNMMMTMMRMELIVTMKTVGMRLMTMIDMSCSCC